MQALLLSDGAWLWGWIILVTGLADLCIGFLWLDKGRGAERVKRDAPRLLPYLSLMVGIDTVLIAMGAVLIVARYFISPS